MKLNTKLFLPLVLALAPACDIDVNAPDDDSAADTDDGDADGGDDGGDGDGDGDDGDGDGDGDDGDGGGDDSSGGDGGDDSGPGDSDGDSGPGADAPAEGTWVYAETGGTTNNCTFFDPTNGWGNYQISDASSSGFSVLPGDGSGAFDCDLDNGNFNCPERLVDEVNDPGLGLQASVYIEVDGALDSPTQMSGSQIGRIDCNGAECAQAALLLGISFPCDFEIPFEGETL